MIFQFVVVTVINKYNETSGGNWRSLILPKTPCSLNGVIPGNNTG